MKTIPGGVNSPVRAFRAVGGNPLFIEKAKGSRIFDADGNSYIDYVLSWGPMILGHAHPRVVAALKKAAEKGTSFGAPTALEVELAERVVKVYPSWIRSVWSTPGLRPRCLPSGWRADSPAGTRSSNLKAAITVMLTVCWSRRGPGLLLSAFLTARVCRDHTHRTPLPFPSMISLHSNGYWKRMEKIACVITEPVVGNIGCVLPNPGFLETLRKLTKKYGIVLIFRRSDDGVSCFFRRRTGILWHQAGHDLPRQGDRRRDFPLVHTEEKKRSCPWFPRKGPCIRQARSPATLLR